MTKQSLFFSFVLVLFCASYVMPQESGAVILPLEQAATIRSELNAMRLQVQLLRTQSQNWKADSLTWQNKCTQLEEKLNQALLLSESSEKSVLELQEQVQILRTLLAELKKEFNELNESYLRQKRTLSFWRTTAIVLGVTAAVEGVIIWLQNK